MFSATVEVPAFVLVLVAGALGIALVAAVWERLVRRRVVQLLSREIDELGKLARRVDTPVSRDKREIG